MALTIAHVRGIPIRLHVLFLVVLPVFAYVMASTYFAADATWPPLSAWIWGSLLALGLFASVLLHELAHSLRALKEGMRVRHVTLLPIGGVSAFDEMPETPGVEFRVTIVGPLTNVALAIPCYAAGVLLPIALPASIADSVVAADAALFLVSLGVLNLALGLFNLLVPAFPMDGGRLLRSALATRVGRVKATKWAAALGRTLAVAMGIFGFLTFSTGGWLLLLVALFVYQGASAEEAGVAATEILGHFRVADVMSAPVDVIPESATAHEAFARMLATRHSALPMVDAQDAWRVTGLVRLDDLKRVPSSEAWFTRVPDVAANEWKALRATDPATALMRAMEPDGRARDPVIVLDAAERLVGVVTREDIGRFVEIALAHPLSREMGRGPAGGRPI